MDTANVEDIKKANDMGVICGVTEAAFGSELVDDMRAFLSPHYIATRDGSETTIPKDDLREKKQ